MADLSDSVVSNNVNTSKELSVVQNKEASSDNKTDKVMEPILVEELTFKQKPQSVKNLIQYLEKYQQTSTKDILAGLVYILFLESGFIPSEYVCDEEIKCWDFHYQRVLRLSRKLPTGWKNENVYSFTFLLDPYYEQYAKVTCCSAAEDLIVNCVVQNVDYAECNSVCLDPLLYFLDSNPFLPHQRLQNLKRLSNVIKDFAYCAKQEILRADGQIYMCLEAQPLEILLEIVTYLGIEDLGKFGRVSKYCADVLCTEKVWYNLLERDYKNAVSTEERELWKVEKYRELIVSYKSLHHRKILALRRERERSMAVHSYLLGRRFDMDTIHCFGSDIVFR